MRTTSTTFLGTCCGLLLASLAASGALAQKATMAIRGFEATPAVRSAAEAAGTLNALDQIIQGAERQLESELQRSQKFDIVARGDLETILKEQDLADSGLVDQLDPNTARSLQLAGARYVAILTIDGFQDVTDRTTLQKQLGPTRAERRSIVPNGRSARLGGWTQTGRDLQFTAELSIVDHPPVARRSALWIDGIS